MEKNMKIKVTNRDNGTVGYTIPDLNVRRIFIAGETKEIDIEELRKLAGSVPGGKTILANLLVVQDENVVKELLENVEPEYYYSEEDIKNLLLNGSLDQVKDCLDFAPRGVIDLIKKYSVELKINDLSKREAIFNKTGFNVTSAIEINKETEDEKEVKEEKVRRTEVQTSTTNSTRKTTPVTGKYKIVG